MKVKKNIKNSLQITIIQILTSKNFPPFWRKGDRFMKYELKGEEYIELIKLLKILRISESGGQAKLMVEDGIVYLNGEQEFRKRAKLRVGDVVEVMDFKIRIVH